MCYPNGVNIWLIVFWLNLDVFALGIHAKEAWHGI
jgi:hypothetical protein